MQPWKFLPVHPLLTQIIESIVIMKVDRFSLLSVSATFDYPWTAQINLFFTMSEQGVTVRTGDKEYFEPYPHHFILGPCLQRHRVQCPETHHVLCIAFRPGAFRRLYRLPVSEIINEAIDISLLKDHLLEELAKRLEDPANHSEAHQLVTQYFLHKLTSLNTLQPLDAAINAVLRAGGNISIDHIADMACLSGRQLERRCADSLGVTPKLFARLTRFAKAYMIKETHPEQSWTHIAYACGYYDQNHLVRDFKHFSGVTPTEVEAILQSSLTAMTALQSKGI